MSEHLNPSRPAILAILSLAAASLAGGEQVRELGPAPISNGQYTGRISAIVCDPVDSNRYFVGGADGGVWRTSDGGVNWTPLTDGLPTTAVGALALDPADADVVYLGSGEANFANHSRYGLGLFKSTDGGLSWSQLAESTFAGRCFSKLIVSPADPQVVYAAITPAGGFPEKAAAKGHPAKDGPIGVFRSNDGGATWSQLLNGLPNEAATDLALDPANPGTGYAAIGRIFGSSSNGIYKTSDGGDSWIKLAGGLPTTSVGRISVAVAPSNPSRLYTLITNPADANGGGASVRGGWRSSDAGATWTSINVPSIQSTYGWYLSLVTVQPTNANTVVMGGLELVRSTNSGVSFSTITPPHVDMHAAAWDAAGRLLIGDDGGVHRSANLGTSWSSLNTGLGVIQFYAGLSTHPADDQVVLGGTQDNGTNLRSADSLAWVGVLGGDGGWTQIDQAAPLRSFGEYQGSGNLYRSTNGGASYNYVGTGINTSDRNAFLPPYLIDPTDSNRMLYATQRVYRSLNGGTSWSVLSGDLSDGSGAIRALAMAPSDPDVVYAATNDGNVQLSTDGGATFGLILDGHPGWPRVTREITVDPTDPSVVYLATAHFGAEQVLRSGDAGASWQSLDGDLPDLPVNVVAVDARWSPAELYAGSDAGLYRSLDDGHTWQKIAAGMPNAAIIDLRLDTGRERLIVGTQGRGAWEVSIEVQADLDGDGDVDLIDLSLLLTEFGCADGCSADLDGDGGVDLTDLSLLLIEFGRRS